MNTPYPIDPSISAEQERWNSTAIGLLKRLLWQIETGQIKPKEMAVCYLDYKGGVSRSVALESTGHDPIKIHGMLCVGLHAHAGGLSDGGS